VAHGEGRFFCPDQAALEEIARKNLAPIRFADDSGMITENYPSNPNGSALGITALCSPDGRHLAMMPILNGSFFVGNGPIGQGSGETWKPHRG